MPRDVGRSFVSPNFRLSLLTGGAVLAIAGLVGLKPALAQDAPTSSSANSGSAIAPENGAPAEAVLGQAANASQGAVADIVVTGTSIRGVAPVGSNLVSVSRNDIVATSASSINQLLATVPQLTSFNVTPGISAGGQGAGLASQGPVIHGIPGGALVLINGHRFVGAGQTGIAPDPNVLPLLAIQRVEVVPDGASSIYGSDAVTGVVNFITRTDLNGIESEARYNYGPDYHTYDLGLAAGRKWDTGSAMIAYEYQGHNMLLTRDLDFRIPVLKTSCTPGNITVGGATYATPGLQPGANSCDIGQYIAHEPTVKRHSVIATAKQEVGSHVELFAESFYSHLLDYSSITSTQAAKLSVTPANPYYLQVPGTPIGATQSVSYYPQQDFGYTIQRYRAESFGASGGATIKLGSFNLLLRGNYSKERDLAVFNGESQQALVAAAMGTTVGTALNPYGDSRGTDPAVLAALRDTTGFKSTNAHILEGLAKLDGTLFSLPGGDVKLAAGTEIRQQVLHQQTRDYSTGPLYATGGDQDVNSVFAELYIPLVGNGNSLPFVHKLAVSASGRYDHYKGIGNTTNPKVGVNWDPVEGFTLRGSYGTSFNAPNIGDQFASDTRLQVIGQSNGFQNVVYLAGGNPALKPQTATTWSVGGDFAPRFAPHLRASLTYFNINYKNLITVTPAGEVFACARGLATCNPEYNQFVYLHPDAATLGSLLAIVNGRIDGVLPSNIDVVLDRRRTNLGLQKRSGLDFNLNYTIDVAGGSIVAGINGTQFTKLMTAASAGQPYVDTIARTPKTYLRASLSGKFGPYSGSMFLNYTGGYQNINISPAQNVHSFKTVDLHVARDFTVGSERRNLQLFVDVTNLFDKNPPLYLNPTGDFSGFDVANASILGRMVSVGARVKF